MDDALELLEGMSPIERKRMLIADDGRAATQGMEDTINRYEYFTHEIKVITSLGMQALDDYNESNSEEDLQLVELYADMLKTFTDYRAVLREEIREWRERVRWLRAEYQRTRVNSQQPKS